MDLIAQRGLPVRAQEATPGAPAAAQSKGQSEKPPAAPDEGNQEVIRQNHNRKVCGANPAVDRPPTAATAWGQAMSKGIMSPPANVRPPNLQNVGIEQHLDGQVPPDLVFVDDAGRTVKLGDYFGKKPLILNLVYYNCPMLCGEALAGLTGAMKMVKFDVGDQFDVLTVSFNPQETPAIAAAKKQDYLGRYGRPGAASGWHFLTGPAESINALTKAVGFQYQYDPKINQYAHATAIMVLTPQGRISRYFYGVDYPPKDLRMGLVEACRAKSATPSIRCCSTAITTIPPPENTARS